jgi:hypothetical protein
MSRCSQYRVLATDISKSLSCQDASPCHEVVDVPVHQVQEELLVTPVIMQKDMDALSMVFFGFHTCNHLLFAKAWNPCCYGGLRSIKTMQPCLMLNIVFAFPSCNEERLVHRPVQQIIEVPVPQIVEEELWELSDVVHADSWHCQQKPWFQYITIYLQSIVVHFSGWRFPKMVMKCHECVLNWPQAYVPVAVHIFDKPRRKEVLATQDERQPAWMDRTV